MNICAGFDYSARVLTASGAYKPIYKLVVGDHIVNKHGHPVLIKQIGYNRNKKHTIKLTQTN